MVTLRWFVTEIEYGCTMDMRALFDDELRIHALLCVHHGLQA